MAESKCGLFSARFVFPDLELKRGYQENGENDCLEHLRPSEAPYVERSRGLPEPGESAQQDRDKCQQSPPGQESKQRSGCDQQGQGDLAGEKPASLRILLAPPVEASAMDANLHEVDLISRE